MRACVVDTRIRPEFPNDAAAIEAVTIAAFRSAAHASHTEQHIVAGLRRAGALTISLVAERHDEVIGHVAISPVRISDGTIGWFGLGPISVLPAHQRQGVGLQLMREALDLLRARGAAGCVVLGEPAYYGRFGFRATPGLELPGVRPAYFQALAFGSGMPKGVVRYHEAFDA